MRATIDKAGRLVIPKPPKPPKPLRDHLGLGTGEVEVVADGTALRVEAVAGSELVEWDGRLVIASSGASLADDDVRRLRDADRR